MIIFFFILSQNRQKQACKFYKQKNYFSSWHLTLECRVRVVIMYIGEHQQDTGAIRYSSH